MPKPTKKNLLKETIEHIDITRLNVRKLVDSWRKMSFSSRDTANATDIYNMMLGDKKTTIWLTLAGSTSAGGCMQVYVDMVKNNMVDCIVATGASIVDMDFFEALGFKHYRGTPFINDGILRSLYIDRIYDTFIDEENLQVCDRVISKIADSLEPRAYSSREFIREMGRYLTKHAKKKNSLVQTAFENNVPIFCPAFIDSSAGFGLVIHQEKHPENHLTIDSIKDFRELTEIKMKSKDTGLFMVGGGVPKNFAQDTVVCAEVLGKNAPVHKYAVQITVADVRDGACSSSTLKEAASWGKVTTIYEQMVYAEATTVVPIIAAYAYQTGNWKKRKKPELAKYHNFHKKEALPPFSSSLDRKVVRVRVSPPASHRKSYVILSVDSPARLWREPYFDFEGKKNF
ncbi:MAG: Deoxyhypusine synthase-like protein [Parcubacteria group bacterium GW2011_GWA2_42_18]|nr:MAG: Deoxyhypusine synthase-like protein [Parcubacteria group bacterium GW2011_GWA2_42_18]